MAGLARDVQPLTHHATHSPSSMAVTVCGACDRGDYIIDFTQQGGGISIPVRIVVYSFGRDGYNYAMTMRS